MGRRREYRVSWQRVDRPRHSKRFPTKRRAESYLAAVRAMTADERYGDKVDKLWHCIGSSGDGYSEPYEECYKHCGGKTWREQWNEKFMQPGMELKPLSWSSLSSRPLPDWEDEDEEAVEFGYGDVLRPKKGIASHRIMVINDTEAWNLKDRYPLQGATIPYGKHNWVKIDG